MSIRNGLLPLLAIASSLLAGGALAADAPVPATWQEHKVDFDYFAITSNYSCSGMEGKVKELLLQFGARKDVQVHASACNERDMPYGHALTVQLKFSSLAPLDPAAAPGTQPVATQWTPVQINSHHPTSMGEGDCDLVEQLREIITKNFTSRNLEYQSTCTPHQIGVNSFSVRGEFLKAPAH